MSIIAEEQWSYTFDPLAQNYVYIFFLFYEIVKISYFFLSHAFYMSLPKNQILIFRIGLLQSILNFEIERLTRFYRSYEDHEIRNILTVACNALLHVRDQLNAATT